MNLSRSFDFTYLKSILLWLVIFTFLYSFAYYYGWVDVLPNAKNLKSWDAAWYFSILTNGYEYIPDIPCNSGFFPLFPLFWKLFGGSAIVISLINCVLFLSSVFCLAKVFQPNRLDLLVCFSFPSMFFFYVPYSESLFFVFSTLILIGLKKENNWLTAMAIFFASLTRPTFLFFVPAFCFLFLMEVKRDNFFELLKRYFLYYGLPTILALVIFILFQKWQTGEWLPYFRVQRNVWSRGFRFPTLPFGSPDGKAMLWIEAISFWIGVFTVLFTGKIAWEKITNKEVTLNKPFLLSVAYLSMAFFSIVFFNPVWEIERTILNGINRYIFAAPFFFLLFWKIADYIKIKNNHLIHLVLFSFLTWLFLENYFLHIRHFIYFLCITAYILLLVIHLKYRKLSIAVFLVTINLMGQIYLITRFLNGEWAG